MMTTLDMLKMFWNDWSNHDPEYYKVYVGTGTDFITPAQYKDLTGVDYIAPVAQPQV